MNLPFLLLGLFGSPDPWALIQRSELARSVSMEAVVRTTFWMPGKDGRSKTMRFRMLQDSGRLQIEPLDGGPKLQERQGKLEGHGKRPMFLPPRLSDEMELNLARRNYAAILEKRDSISGRLCEVVRLKPRHAGGNGRRLWIDPVTGLALRRDQYNERGELIRSSTMESVQRPGSRKPPPDAPHAAAPDADREPPAPPPAPQPGEPQPGQQLLGTEDANRWLGFEAPRATWVPEGFVPVGAHSHTCPEGGHALRMAWSDGLSSFSLIVQPASCLRPAEVPHRSVLQKIGRWLHPRREPIHPPVVVARLGDKGEVLAMGDMPRPLLERIVNSLASPNIPIRILPQNETHEAPRREP